MLRMANYKNIQIFKCLIIIEKKRFKEFLTRVVLKCTCATLLAPFKSERNTRHHHHHHFGHHHHHYHFGHHLLEIIIALLISILLKIHNIPVTRAINMKSWKMKRQRVIVIMIDFHLTQINIWSLIRSAPLWDEMIDLEGPVQKRLLHKCADSFFFFRFQKSNNWKIYKICSIWRRNDWSTSKLKNTGSKKTSSQVCRRYFHLFPAFKAYLGQGCIFGVQWKFFALSFAVYVTNAVKESSVNPHDDDHHVHIFWIAVAIIVIMIHIQEVVVRGNNRSRWESAAL